MSVGQGNPSNRARNAREGIWSPRIRLRIIAVLLVINSLSIIGLFTRASGALPAWINAVGIVVELTAAALLWLVARLAHPSTVLAWSAVAATIASAAHAAASASLLRSGSPAMIGISLLVNAIIVAIVLTAVRGVRREASAARIHER